ncbi:XRE family transcriptional regulator [Bdellovibrio sp. HCB209]|uniref:XRE family transcriptional regulator n=1 Tax=Bdellovibrio sp. HCB209 TaxID=3394354 RepID=UPI0039B4E75D
MAKIKKIKVSRNPKDLATDLGLPPSIAIEWEIRRLVTERIIQVAESQGLRVTTIALKSETSRARVTRILKGDTEGISLDVLLRILGSMGQKVEMKFKAVS